MTRIPVDTGPRVALIDESESHHEWTRQQLAEIRPPLYTCEAVIAEAVYLLASAIGAIFTPPMPTV